MAFIIYIVMIDDLGEQAQLFKKKNRIANNLWNVLPSIILILHFNYITIKNENLKIFIYFLNLNVVNQ